MLANYKKYKIGIVVAFFIIIFVAPLFSSSLWEGGAAMADYGDFPFDGNYGASNTFVQNSYVEVENLENGKKTKVIIVDRLADDGLLMRLSNDASKELGISKNDIVKIRVKLISVENSAKAPVYDDIALNPDPDINASASLLTTKELVPAKEPDVDKTEQDTFAAPEVEEKTPEPKTTIDDKESEEKTETISPEKTLENAVPEQDKKTEVSDVTTEVENKEQDSNKTKDQLTLDDDLALAQHTKEPEVNDELSISDVPEPPQKITETDKDTTEENKETTAEEPLPDKAITKEMPVVEEMIIAEKPVVEEMITAEEPSPIKKPLPESPATLVAEEIVEQAEPEQKTPIVEEMAQAPDVNSNEEIIETVEETPNEEVASTEEDPLNNKKPKETASDEILQTEKEITPSISQETEIEQKTEVELVATDPSAPEGISMVTMLQKKKHYLQIGAFNKKAAALKAAEKFNGIYPVAIFSDENNFNENFKLLLGPLTEDESGAMLYTFRSEGYPDAFIRRVD